LIFNELEYAEKMLKSGFISDKYIKELNILAKYCNKSLNLKTDEVKKKLKEFCKKHLPEYNEVLHLDMITKATQYGVKKKNTLVQINPITITKNELTKIESLHDVKLEKIAFVALVLSKIDKSKQKKKTPIPYYCNDFKELFISSKIRCNKIQRENFIDQLAQTTLFDLTIYCTLKVNFVDELSEVVFKVKYYENLVMEYILFKGENIDHCEKCGIPFSPTNNRQKYCKECWKEKWKEYNAEKQREYYNNKKSVCLENA